MKLFLFFLLSLFFSTLATADLKFPDRERRAVVDNAHLLSPSIYTDMSKQLTQWHLKTHHDLVVVTVPDLQGYDIADYGYKLGRAWKLGRTGIDDGAILIYAQVNGHGKVRLEVARGFEPVLTDALSKQIIHQVATQIKTKNVESGLQLGVNLVTSYVDAHEQEVKRAPVTNSSSGPVGWIVGGGFTIVAIFAALFYRRKKKVIVPVPINPLLRSKPSSTSNRSYYPSTTYLYTRGGYRSSNLTTSGAAAAVATSYESSRDSDNNYSRRSSSSSSDSSSSSFSSNDISDIGFSSSNDDSSSFSGGGASEDC